MWYTENNKRKKDILNVQNMKLVLGSLIAIGLVVSFVDWKDFALIGGWFDRASDALILDQRLFWVFVLLFLAVNGAGRLSLDHWLNIDKSPE